MYDSLLRLRPPGISYFMLFHFLLAEIHQFFFSLCGSNSLLFQYILLLSNKLILKVTLSILTCLSKFGDCSFPYDFSSLPCFLKKPLIIQYFGFFSSCDNGNDGFQALYTLTLGQIILSMIYVF